MRKSEPRFTPGAQSAESMTVQTVDRKEHFGGVSAPNGPNCGPVGAGTAQTGARKNKFAEGTGAASRLARSEACFFECGSLCRCLPLMRRGQKVCARLPLMRRAQEVEHDLDRIEGLHRHFYKERIPIAHSAIPQSGHLQCLELASLITLAAHKARLCIYPL